MVGRLLTHSMSSGLTAVVKQRHVSQTVAVVHVAATLQDLRQRATTKRRFRNELERTTNQKIKDSS